MTEEQFIQTALTFPNIISIWYSVSSPYLIKGILIPVINGNVQNILEYLEEATELTVEIQTGITVNLQVGVGQLRTATTGEKLYYFKVTPEYDITSIASSPTFITQLSVSRITFINVANQYEFNASGYNVLLNNVDDIRASEYQYSGQTVVLANVQDSLYSSTGWINGRYEGSQTSKTNYLGIEPTITGKSFQGAYFPRTVTDPQLLDQVSLGVAAYTEYLYPGDDILPTSIYTTDSYRIAGLYQNGELSTAVGTILPSVTEIPLLTIEGAALTAPTVTVGQILQVQGSLELMKIKSIGSYPNNGLYNVDTQPLYRLTVERGYNYSTPQPIVTQALPTLIEPPVQLSTPTLIYKLAGSKIQGAQRGKLHVQLSGEILHIDLSGYIVSGSNKGV